RRHTQQPETRPNATRVRFQPAQGTQGSAVPGAAQYYERGRRRLSGTLRDRQQHRIALSGRPHVRAAIQKHNQEFFFDLNAINAGGSRPDGFEPTQATKLAVIGAGMMGAGIAHISAAAGIDVVLKDVSMEAAEKGKAHAQQQLDKRVSRKQIDATTRDETL